LLNDRIHWADFSAFAIIGAFAGINDVNYITHGNGAGGADGFAGTTRYAFFVYYMRHFLLSFRLLILTGEG
jgi:hypothetical protein